MIRALWTDFSCPECCPLQPCLYRDPVPSQGEQGRWKPREGGNLPRITVRLRRCQAWNHLPPQPVPFCLVGGLFQTLLYLFLSANIKPLGMSSQSILSSGLGVEGLRNTQTPDNGLQTSQSSAQCQSYPSEHSDGKGADTSQGLGLGLGCRALSEAAVSAPCLMCPDED